MWNNFMAPKIKKEKQAEVSMLFLSDEEEQLEISYENVDFMTL